MRRSFRRRNDWKRNSSLAHQALPKRWVLSRRSRAHKAAGPNPRAAARQAFTNDTGLRATADNREVVAAANLLVLAVKPQTMAALLQEIRPVVTARSLSASREDESALSKESLLAASRLQPLGKIRQKSGLGDAILL